MKILDRYIIKELLAPFIFGVATFTLLFISVDMLFRVAKMLIENKCSLIWGIKYLANSLPQVLVFTFPMSILLACLLAFGRLSGESEIIAMKAGGIDFYRIAAPAIFVALIITALSFYISESIAPQTTFRANNILIKELLKEDRSRDNILMRGYTADGQLRITYALKFYPETGIMEGVTIQEYSNNIPTRWIEAKRAIWKEDFWELKDGNIYNISQDENRDIDYITSFETSKIMLPESPSDIELRERTPEEMDRNLLSQKMELLKRLVKNVSSKDEELELNKQYQVAEVLYQQKLSMPFTCFIFSLFGIPLGLRPHRTSTSIGLGLSIVIIFVYYILLSTFRAFGENNFMPAVLSAWMPNIIFGTFGVYLIYKTGKV